MSDPTPDEKPKPIPREEPPPPIPAPVEDVAQRTLRLLEQMNVKQDTHASVQATQGVMLEGMRSGLLSLASRVETLEAKAPGSNPPPRTASGFIQAVDARAKAISVTTESEPDKATAAQVAELKATVADIKKEMGLQTQMLGTLVDGLGSFARNPTVRKTVYVAGGLFLGWLTHLAAQKGFSFP